MAELIDRVRSFNRTVTERIGALQDEYLAAGRPLGASRVLWEIPPEGCEIKRIRARLNLDSGYLSRLLRRLEDEGLVRLEADRADQRARSAWLTGAGRRARARLDQRSDELAESLLEPLTQAQRQQLVDAMTTVERLFTAGMVEISPGDPAGPAATWCLRAYFAELDSRFEAGFDPRTSIPAASDDLLPPNGLLLLAWLRGAPVGCGALKLNGHGPAEIKRMWVDPDARGFGVGRRILIALEEQARASGAGEVRLETNRNLREAIALYRGQGYREVPAFSSEPYAHHWFAKRLRPEPGAAPHRP